MTITESVLIAAAYPNKADAEAAVKELADAGYGQGSISLVYTDPGSVVKEGLIQGAVFGGVVGGLVGLLFPPLGLLIAAGPIVGPLASAISGAASLAVAGAAIGGLVSGLIALGMPEEMANRFGQHVHKGDVLVVVHTSPSDAARVRQILEQHAPRVTEASTDTSATAQQATA